MKDLYAQNNDIVAKMQRVRKMMNLIRKIKKGWNEQKFQI